MIFPVGSAGFQECSVSTLAVLSYLHKAIAGNIYQCIAIHMIMHGNHNNLTP